MYEHRKCFKQVLQLHENKIHIYLFYIFRLRRFKRDSLNRFLIRQLMMSVNNA